MTDLTESEMKEEIAWAISRPKSLSYGVKLDDILLSGNPWANALTDAEASNLAHYRLKHGAMSNKVYALNQREECGFGNASSESILQTVIKNTTILWVDSQPHGRWLTPRELMKYQGLNASRSGAPIVYVSVWNMWW
jgi:hypothetical protein